MMAKVNWYKVILNHFINLSMISFNHISNQNTLYKNQPEKNKGAASGPFFKTLKCSKCHLVERIITLGPESGSIVGTIREPSYQLEENVNET